jgi:hypothetical protein
MTSNEQRREERLNLFFYFEVYNTQTEKLIGHLQNITHNGILILSPEKFTKDTELKVSITLDEAMLSDKSFSASTIVKWCSKDTATGSYNIGCEFTDTENVNKNLVAKLIDKVAERN